MTVDWLPPSLSISIAVGNLQGSSSGRCPTRESLSSSSSSFHYSTISPLGSLVDVIGLDHLVLLSITRRHHFHFPLDRIIIVNVERRERSLGRRRRTTPDLLSTRFNGIHIPSFHRRLGCQLARFYPRPSFSRLHSSTTLHLLVVDLSSSNSSIITTSFLPLHLVLVSTRSFSIPLPLLSLVRSRIIHRFGAPR